jgi:hypothetical protein
MLGVKNMRIVKNMPDRFRQAAVAASYGWRGPIDRNGNG